MEISLDVWMFVSVFVAGFIGIAVSVADKSAGGAFVVPFVVLFLWCLGPYVSPKIASEMETARTEANAPAKYETVEKVRVDDDTLHDYDILQENKGQCFLRVREKNTGNVVAITRTDCSK